MYKCLNCGRLFDEAYARKEIVGEFWGIPTEQEFGECPFCKGEYEETVCCEICGREFLDEEMATSQVCKHCIDKYRKKFNVCYNVSFGETKNIEINALLASLFYVGDIEQILKEFIQNRCPDVDCSQFIDEDISWFGERLAEEVRKNENTKG